MTSSSSTTTQASSQVEIRHRPVSWRFPRSEFGETKEFYDEYHEEIILITSQFICKSHRQSSKLNKFNIKVPNHERILNAKFSPQNKYIGLQINPHELEIKTIRGSIVVIQQCRNIKNGNYILDFHWINTKTSDICIITCNGIELYGFIPSKKSMTLIKSIKYPTKHHWYLPSTQFIMLINNNYVFYGVKLTYNKFEKINKFEIVGVDHIVKNNNNSFYDQITLVNINNNIGCIFVDERKTKLYLFKVIRHQMQLTHSYHLYSQGKYSIFHIDNILVAYNRNTEMPILIDFNGNNYISAPLPITMCYYEGNDPKKPKRIFSTQKHITISPNINININSNKKHKRILKTPPSTTPPPPKPSKIAKKRYKFISPLFILEQWTEAYPIKQNNQDKASGGGAAYFSSGNFYTLSLNLSAIVHSWGPERQIPLLQFLLHREITDSKNIIIKLLYDMIKYYCLGYRYDIRSRLDFISEYFILLNEVLRRAVEESSIIAQNRREQLLLKQQQQQHTQSHNNNTQPILNRNKSFSYRFKKSSQSYAAKLFGTPPMPSSTSSSSTKDNALSNHVMNNGLPPPHFPISRSKSVANVNENGSRIGASGLPLPQQHISNNNGRRVAPNVKFDLQKTSHNETVIKTTELLDDIFNPIYNMLLKKEKQVLLLDDDDNDDDNDGDNNDNDDDITDLKLYENKKWNSHEINKCLNRFLAVLIEYTRTMHRIRLKLPIAISMLLISLLRHTNKLYTLHQLFQYHAFPDDEKLAMQLLDIASYSSSNDNDNDNDQKDNNDDDDDDDDDDIIIHKYTHPAYPQCKQLGIDMLLRLGRWSKICSILLNENEIECGVRLFLEKYPFDKKGNIEQIQLTDFLKAALNKDPIKFYHLYQGLNMIISSHHSIFSYYSDYYTQTLYGTNNNNQQNNQQSNNQINQPGQIKSSKIKYGYNNNSRATNLHVLFNDEMLNFKSQFDSLHKKFVDENN